MSLYVGLGGVRRHGCVTLCTEQEVLGICEQERITRASAAGFNQTGLPDEALDTLLDRSGRRRCEIISYAIGETLGDIPGLDIRRLDHHLAHAYAAFLPSPYESAVIVICDHSSPAMSVWDGDGTRVSRIEWPWQGIGLAETFSQFAQTMGFGAGHEQRMEALARLHASPSGDEFNDLVSFGSNHLTFASRWRERVESAAATTSGTSRSVAAAALQSRLGDLLVEFLRQVKRRVPHRTRLCVGGSLFFNSYYNSRVKQSGIFGDVFVPISPGNAGLSVGAALHLNGRARLPVGPFLGPAFSSEEIKATLDNCKLTYMWASDQDAITIATEALQKGRLVGWFDGPMEWGARSLGARSIVANPFSPYVLDNLNRFLKHRDPWRGYALSGLESAVSHHFVGPADSRFMECDYVPRDRERFRHILPGPDAGVRLQTVDSDSPIRFRGLLEAFGQATGVPTLVNTSFNGFREPMVCSPRDAIRVFFGTGLDLLVLGGFVISK